MWNDVKRIYDRITFLRQKGVRMKEMAERSATSPSVLSAIYSTVFPAYFSGLEKGKTCDEALEEALIWVNNVSKKKFFNTLAALNETLFTTDFCAETRTHGWQASFYLGCWKTESRRQVTR